MAVFHTTRRVAFSPEQLFEIVADVAAYPEFLPLCTGARVWDETITDNGKRQFQAALDIEYA
ncbi:MAG: SRPBCC family protein, partial [Anderseniella sp.]